jgi:hypothetical protein
MLVLSRARTLAAMAVLVCAFLAAGLVSASPARASDTADPVLVSQSVAPTTFNLHDGPATINISIRLTDATGVQTPTMVAGWVPPDTWPSGPTAGHGQMTLDFGTIQDGIWKHSITIPQGSARGEWDVILHPLSDALGNSSTRFLTLATVTVKNEAPRSTVAPSAVTFSDQDGTANDAYTVPATTGIEYVKNGIVIAAGTYPAKTTVTVTARAAAGYVMDGGAQSYWTATFSGFLLGTAPRITGTVTVGSTLTAKPGTWSPASVNLYYQWYRSGVAITGATASTFRLTTADLGKAITVKTTARKTGYKVASKTSRPTAAVATNLLTAVRPTISGTPAVGQTLTVQTGRWSPSGIRFTYQWYRNGSPIAGATASSYTVVTEDLGAGLSIRVIGRKSGYVAKGSTSNPTAPVSS